MNNQTSISNRILHHPSFPGLVGYIVGWTVCAAMSKSTGVFDAVVLGLVCGLLSAAIINMIRDVTRSPSTTPQELYSIDPLKTDLEKDLAIDEAWASFNFTSFDLTSVHPIWNEIDPLATIGAMGLLQYRAPSWSSWSSDWPPGLFMPSKSTRLWPST